MSGRLNARHLPAGLLLLLYFAGNLYPFTWMVATSLKQKANSFVDTGLVPHPLSTEGYHVAWNVMNALRAFLNSVLYAGSVTLIVLLVYPLAGFVLATVRFRGREALFRLLVSGLVLPSITLLVPVVLLDQKLGLLNSWPGLIIPTVSAAGPIPLFLMRNYFRLLPYELVEAARLDGASYLRVYTRIFLPLSVPALTTVTILTVVYVWNAYILPNVIISNPNMFPLPLAVFGINATGVPGPNELMAGAVIMIVPLIGAFLALQRYYVSGLTLGAVKA